MKKIVLLFLCLFLVVGFISCKDDVTEKNKNENTQNKIQEENKQEENKEEYKINKELYSTEVDSSKWTASFNALVNVRNDLNLAFDNSSKTNAKDGMFSVPKGITETNLGEEKEKLSSNEGFKLFVNKETNPDFYCLVAPWWDVMYSTNLQKSLTSSTTGPSVVLARFDERDLVFKVTEFCPSSKDWSFYSVDGNDQSFYNYMKDLLESLKNKFSNATFNAGKYTVVLESVSGSRNYIIGFNSDSELGYIKTPNEEIEITYLSPVEFDEYVPTFDYI